MEKGGEGEFHRFSHFLNTFPHLKGSFSTVPTTTSPDWPPPLPSPSPSRGVFLNDKTTITNVDHGFRSLEDVGGVHQTNGDGLTNTFLSNFQSQSGGAYDPSGSEQVRNPYTLQSFFSENVRSSGTVPGRSVDMANGGRKQSCINESDCFSLKEPNSPGFPIKTPENGNLLVGGSHQKISTSSSSSLELFHGEESNEIHNINRQLNTTWFQTYDYDCNYNCNCNYNFNYNSSVVSEDTPMILPTRKRKFVPVQQNHVSRSGWNFIPYGVNTTNLSQIVMDPVLHFWQQRVLETSQIYQKNSSSPSPSTSGGNQILLSTSVCIDTDDKELERRGLSIVLKKELRRSDVSSLGRIVLPKKQAEGYLPYLTQKEGIQLQMRDFTYSGVWTFKYRYWPNNKSRMYIMENTGDFVRIHGLKTGDFFAVYVEHCSGTFIVRGMKHDGGAERSQSQGNENVQ